MVDVQKFPLIWFDYRAKFGYCFSYGMRACGGLKKFLARLGYGAWLTRPSSICLYHAEFGRSRSNRVSVNRGPETFKGAEPPLLRMRGVFDP